MNGQKHDSKTPTSAAPIRSLIDMEGLRRRLGQDDDAIEEILRAFAQEAPKLVSQLGAAISGGERDLVRRLAHSLKGSLLWIGADEAAAAAQALEHDAAGPPSSPEEIFEKMRENIEILLQALHARSPGTHP
jgi:HPt (histidine-containing phosphotransfer) domain-containing protein